jgi:ribosomal protein S18 acetylase RimI-like enzyme
MVPPYHGDMSEALAITQARPSDLAAVLAIDDRPDRATELSEAVVSGRCSVAQVGGVIVGFGVRGTFFGHDFLELLVIAVEHRRQGVGAALVEAFVDRSPGAKVFTSTNASNAPMRALCERLGFVEAGTIDHLDEGDPEVVYVLLTPDAAAPEALP